MKKLTILSAILSLFAFAAVSQANDSSYNAEISLDYGQSNVDDTDLLDLTTYSLNGTYYFSGVNTKQHPLAEAAFLEKSSNLYAQWNRIEYDNIDVSGNINVIGADFYVPNSMFFLGAGVIQVDGDGDDDTTWIAKLGITPIDGLLVWSQFYEDQDVAEDWNINAKYVVPLVGETAVNLEVSYVDGEDGDSATHVAADYYFTRSFSLGAGYTFADEDDGYQLRARNFFSDKFSVEAAYTSDDFEDGWLVGASLRF